MGSIVYVGLIGGSIAATGLFSKGELIKPTLALSLCGNVVSLLFFSSTTNFYFMIIYRAMIGFFQIFICIYMPIWADAFGK